MNAATIASLIILRQRGTMHARVKGCLKFVALVAGIIALQPYIRFLVAPRAEDAQRWTATVIALGVLAGVVILLGQTRASEREK